MSSPRIVTLDEVKKHNTEQDCWIVIDKQVLDVTKFLSLHPGGSKTILPYAGKDASEIFHVLHSDLVLSKYKNLCIGIIQPEQKSIKSTDSTDTLLPLHSFASPYWYNLRLKSPYYTEAHRKFAKKVNEFVEKEITPYAHQWDEAGEAPMELYRKGYEAGIFSIAWPKEYGGTPPSDGYDPFYSLIFLDEMYQSAFGGLNSLFCSSIGLPPVLRVGSKELKDKVARDVITGKKLISLAITEPGAGSDVANLKTTAKRVGDFYIVNGEKKFITGACKAEYYTVACRTGDKGFLGVSLLLLEKGMPGITIRRLKTQGWWSSNTALMLFEDVKVPVTNLIGEENNGFLYIMLNFNGERFAIAAQANSMSRTCLIESIKYAQRRKTFGKRLIDHQVIRHKISEMARQVSSTQAYLEQMAYQMKHGVPDQVIGGQLALCKLQATQTLEFCARESSQILGGASYIRGGIGEKIERIYRDVRVLAIGGGSEEIMRDLAMRQAKL